VVAVPADNGGHGPFFLERSIAMKKLVVIMLIIFGVSVAFAQTTVTTAATLSPAQMNIARAQQLIDKNPKDFEAYNALALALARRARETSDPNFYTQGEQALQKSFAVSPGNYDGARIQVWLLLGKHEFAAAREEATKLNKKVPDDVMVWGFLTDSNVELGNYSEAEDAAQWMLNLRPGNLPGLTRAAYLRELFGDANGSEELMRMALDSTSPSEAEDRAWITTQIAHLKLSTGQTANAEQLLQQALATFPNYHYALGNLGKVRVQQKRYDEAVALFRQRYQAGPHAENLFDLAEALQKAGHSEEANKAFSQFEEKSLAETNRADNSNHELIIYYADYARQPDRALEVARREYARRHDVFTLDCYAWALHVNGQNAEARKQIETALAVGIKDAKLLRHAGEIALSSGDTTAAQRYLRQAADLNAPESERARTTLASISRAGTPSAN
jgi:tetratricopeptide (TPR) repeat protein